MDGMLPSPPSQKRLTAVADATREVIDKLPVLAEQAEAAVTELIRLQSTSPSALTPEECGERYNAINSKYKEFAHLIKQMDALAGNANLGQLLWVTPLKGVDTSSQHYYARYQKWQREQEAERKAEREREQRATLFQQFEQAQADLEASILSRLREGNIVNADAERRTFRQKWEAQLGPLVNSLM